MRLQDRKPRHLRDCDLLRADELGFQVGFAIFEKHLDDFAQIAIELVETPRLRPYQSS